MKRILLGLLFSTLVQLVNGQTVPAGLTEKYEPHVYPEMPYRIMKPLHFDKDKKYPLILSLHGGGGRGTDNLKPMEKEKYNHYLAEEQIRKDFPCYVLAPQSTERWKDVHLVKIKKIINDLESVDMNRIYVLGHSMGGYGTYIFIQLDPDYFAAAAPSAGSGLPDTEDFIDVSVIKDIPIWIFHGDNDPVCPYDKDKKVFEDMKRIGGNMKFTTWIGDNHGVGLKMVTGSDNGITELSSDKCDPEPEFLKWLFTKKLSDN